MNGNRMKYASTPTYGMQKRGLLKKAPPVRQAPEAPDFSQAPDLQGGAFQQPVFQTQQPFGSVSTAAPQQPPVNPYMPYYAQPTSGIPQQPPMTGTVPFANAAPTFVPPVSGMSLPPMQGMPAQQLPLGNTAPAFQPAFGARGQGYAPPQMNQQPTAPNVQPAASFGGTQQPFSGMQMPTGAYVPPSTPNFAPQQPFLNQQPFFQKSAQPAQPVNAPMNVDKLWSVFLFGLLPLLFIPCLFLSGTWNVLRYVFLGLTVIALGGMWYRQMYSPFTRLIVSMVYVALCIGTIAMLVQGQTDVRQTASHAVSQPAAVQESPTPLPEEVDLLAAAQPTPAPTQVGPSEAERRLELFMNLWQIGNAEEMVSLVQPSWGSQQENRSQALFNVLKNRTPEDFVIEDISGAETDNSRTITMRATINKNNGKAPSIYRFMIMMVKEGGEWYVNPNSLATNDTVTTTEENVVNNRNAVGTVTEPPRTTVTPAPPASTPLYYNVGANYYHMDPNCQSVKAEYLPFDQQFSYADLRTVRREQGLSPCLKCNAPTDPLPQE